MSNEEQRKEMNPIGGWSGKYEGAQGAVSLEVMQKFATGATRSADGDKNDYDGFLSFAVVQEFGDYMTRHRTQADGNVRASDNWQLGMTIASYTKSLLRHVLELWGLRRGIVSRRLQKEYPGRSMDFLTRETASACFFNLQGFIHEYLKGDPAVDVGAACPPTTLAKPEWFDKPHEPWFRHNKF
jgi:hypothetical protein